MSMTAERSRAEATNRRRGRTPITACDVLYELALPFYEVLPHQLRRSAP